MGLTLIAISAALLLPGIVGARAFYRAAETSEVEVPTPPLSTSDGIALAGTMSVAVHLLYASTLRAIADLPDRTGLPLANPYLLFSPTPDLLDPLDGAVALFGGLVLLCVLAAPVGFIAGRVVLWRGDRARFYGPLAEIIEQAKGVDRFIVAYVVSKIEKDDRLVGYQGTIVSLFRDEDRYPSKVIMKDVTPFYLKLGDEAPKRQETEETIDTIALTAAEWHNIAFRVYRVEGENEDAGRAVRTVPTRLSWTIVLLMMRILATPVLVIRTGQHVARAQPDPLGMPMWLVSSGAWFTLAGVLVLIWEPYLRRLFAPRPSAPAQTEAHSDAQAA